MSLARASDASFHVSKALVTVFLMIQRKIWNEFRSKKGEIALGIGFDARFWIVEPPETAGTRFDQPMDPVVGNAAAEAFAERVNKLLDAQRSTDGQGLNPPQLLVFDSEAQLVWNDFSNWVEGQLAVGGMFYHYREFGAKHADKVSRLAGVMHLFEAELGDNIVSLKTLNGAIQLGNWFANEYFRLNPIQQEIPKEQFDANRIVVWLAEKLRTNDSAIIYSEHGIFVRKNLIRKNIFRNGITDLNRAVGYLYMRGVAQECKWEPNDTTYLQLNPQFFTQDLVGRASTFDGVWV